LASFGHLTDTETGDFVGRHAGNVGACQLHLAALRAEQTADDFAQRALARPVRPKNADNLTPADVEADVMQDGAGTVPSDDVVHVQHQSSSSSTRSPPPRYASSTAGSFCTSYGVPSAILTPWFSTMTASDTCMTRSMLCSTTRMAMPSFCSPAIRSARNCVSVSSKPAAG